MHVKPKTDSRVLETENIFHLKQNYKLINELKLKVLEKIYSL